MKLLRNIDEFFRWKSTLLEDDEAEVPKEFPCFAYEEVMNWACENVRAKYLSAKDLSIMIQRINNA